MKSLCYCVVCCSLMGNLLAYDGNGLLENCQQQLKVISNLDGTKTFEDGVASGVCNGYVGGVRDTARLWQQGTGRQTYCLPEAAKDDQLIRITIKYIEDNPAELYYPAAALVQFAFIEAFPCKEGN